MFEFGVQYYPEHWPAERWVTDVELMKKARIRIVRLGEFAWSRVEPQEGSFNWGWLDEIIDLLAKADIQIMLGVPIEAPPLWLVKKHPDLPPVRRDGSRQVFGSRNHYCVSHPGMIDVSERLTGAMAQRYAGNKHVTWWQIGNELFKHLHCYCDHCLREFRRWLQRRYEAVEKLNSAWGTVFWSQEYPSFGDVVFPIERPNPGMILDYLRFRRDAVENFHRRLSRIIRQGNPQAKITHNLSGLAGPFDSYSFSEDLDITGVNNSSPSKVDRDAVAMQGAKFDFARSVKRGCFWILEQQVGICTYPPALAPARAPGKMRCWNYVGVAHGAKGLLHYRWRMCPFGDEQFHGGLLRHDGQDDSRFYREATQFGKEMELLREQLSDEIPQGEVGVVTDYESRWSNMSYRWKEPYPSVELVLRYYKGVREYGCRCDFVPASGMGKLDGHRVVLVPHMLLLDAERLRELEAYVSGGGQLVVGPRFGIKNFDNQCFDTVRPGAAARLLGVEIRGWNSVPSNDTVPCLWETPGAGESGRTFRGDTWADLITCTTAMPISTYQFHDREDRPVAAAVNSMGRGSVWTLGTHPVAADSIWVIASILTSAGCKPELHLPDCVDAGLRRSRDGARVWILTNLSDSQQTIALPSPGRDLLTGRQLAQTADIPPNQVVVLQES